MPEQHYKGSELRGMATDFHEAKGYLDTDPNPLFEDTAENYLWVIEQLYHGARGGLTPYGDPSSKEGERSIAAARKMWAQMRNARVFEIGMPLFGLFYHLADRFTTAKSGFDWKAPGSGGVVPGEADALTSYYFSEGPTYPFPSPLPFNTMYLAVSGPEGSVHLDYVKMLTRVNQPTARAWEQSGAAVTLIGTLIDAGAKQITELLHVVTPTAGVSRAQLVLADMYGRSAHGDDVELEQDGWIMPSSLSPWYTNAIIGYLNEHSTTIQTSLSNRQRMDYRKQSKKQRGLIPPMPYYRVRMEKKLIEVQLQKPSTGMRIVSHRHDVRGHEACRVVRGSVPLADKDRRKLLKRGYTIYEGTPPNEEDRRRMEIRGVKPKEILEWLAILTSWRDAHISPADQSLPYVPGVRVPQRKRVVNG